MMAASHAPTRVSEGQTCHALQRTRSLTLHADADVDRLVTEIVYTSGLRG